MKKIISLSLLFLILVTSKVFAQDCFKYFPTKVGQKLEYTDYDKKDKVTGTTTRTVLDKRNENGTQIIDYKIDITPQDGDTTISHTYTIKCKNGVVYIDLSSIINEEQFKKEGMDIVVEGVDVDMPRNPTPGQQLKGGDIDISLVSDGSTLMTIKTTISNRRVETFEKITTSAGTFNTFEIKYDIETSMGFIKVKSSAAEWYSEKYGLIKSESYDKKDKLESYTLLTKIY